MHSTNVGFNWFMLTKPFYLIIIEFPKADNPKPSDFKFDNLMVLVTWWRFPINESPVASVAK